MRGQLQDVDGQPPGDPEVPGWALVELRINGDCLEMADMPYGHGEVVANIRTDRKEWHGAAERLMALWNAHIGIPTEEIVAAGRRRGFTLVELLVVILIVGLVSAVALPAIIPALGRRQVSEAGRILQGAIVGARDKAIHDAQPAGIRLLPDPTLGVSRLADGSIDPAAILCYSRWIPIEAPPQYTEGLASVFPAGTYPAALRTVNGYTGCPCLVVESCPKNPTTGAPEPPTSWFWNIRVGDKIQLRNSGTYYTVCGPLVLAAADGNTELFTNIGVPGTAYPTLGGGQPCEFLLLTNGKDDDGNGWVDEGFDGVDNNGVLGIDENTSQVTEWETERWPDAVARGVVAVPYTIRRRPAPAANAREIALPTSMVIDATTAFSTSERSRLPVNPTTGTVDILIAPDGTVVPSVIYGSPASVGMAGVFHHFWLADRRDLAIPSGTTVPTLPAPKGEYLLMTLNARTGRMVAVDNPPIADPYSGARRGIQ